MNSSLRSRFRVLEAAAVGLAWSCLCGCRQQEASPAPIPANVVAQVGERRITVEDVVAALKLHSPAPAPERKRLALEELVRAEVLLRAARSAGYDKRPELLARFDRMVAAEFKEQVLAPRLKAAETIPEEEIRLYYERHADNYQRPEAVRASAILLRCSPKATDEKRAEAVRRAEGLRSEAEKADEAGFARLAQQHSEHVASRYQGGDTGWLVRQGHNTRWPEAVIRAAFALSASGEVAPVVKTEAGYYIVRMQERRAGARGSLAEASEGIRHLLVTEKRREAERRFYEQLESGVSIRINRPALDAVPDPAHAIADKPPTLPGG